MILMASFDIQIFTEHSLPLAWLESCTISLSSSGPSGGSHTRLQIPGWSNFILFLFHMQLTFENNFQRLF